MPVKPGAPALAFRLQPLVGDGERLACPIELQGGPPGELERLRFQAVSSRQTCGGVLPQFVQVPIIVGIAPC